MERITNNPLFFRTDKKYFFDIYDVNQTDPYGKTPLHYYFKSFDEVKSLLENGANPNIRDSFDKTPIFYYINPSIRDLLLKYGAEKYEEKIYNKKPGENLSNLNLFYNFYQIF